MSNDEKRKLLREARRLVGRVLHSVEQLSAKLRDEDRAPTEEEWEQIKEWEGRLKEAGRLAGLVQVEPLL